MPTSSSDTIGGGRGKKRANVSGSGRKPRSKGGAAMDDELQKGAGILNFFAKKTPTQIFNAKVAVAEKQNALLNTPKGLTPQNVEKLRLKVNDVFNEYKKPGGVTQNVVSNEDLATIKKLLGDAIVNNRGIIKYENGQYMIYVTNLVTKLLENVGNDDNTKKGEKFMFALNILKKSIENTKGAQDEEAKVGEAAKAIEAAKAAEANLPSYGTVPMQPSDVNEKIEDPSTIKPEELDSLILGLLTMDPATIKVTETNKGLIVTKFKEMIGAKIDTFAANIPSEAAAASKGGRRTSTSTKSGRKK